MELVLVLGARMGWPAGGAGAAVGGCSGTLVRLG